MLFYPVAMNVHFQQGALAVPDNLQQRGRYHIARHRQRAARATPSMLWQHLVTPGLTELMRSVFLFFFPYLIMGGSGGIFSTWMWRYKSFIAGSVFASMVSVSSAHAGALPACLAFGDAFATQLTRRAADGVHCPDW
ncbi:MAG: hypothetical protein IPM27_11570 [Nitrosomonadales bacterium]|nr:hypothetical protein [Nitrosomonadales bacterium]